MMIQRLAAVSIFLVGLALTFNPRVTIGVLLMFVVAPLLFAHTGSPSIEPETE